MKSPLLVFVAAVFIVTLSRATEVKGPERLRERYVEGVRLIAEARDTINRTSQVLLLVESGADEQANRILQMESHLTHVDHVVTSLKKETARRIEAGETLG